MLCFHFCMPNKLTRCSDQGSKVHSQKKQFKAFINLNGNAWSDAHEIDPFFPIDSNTHLSVIDLLGTGTSCIVWSSDLPEKSHAPMRYIRHLDSGETEPRLIPTNFRKNSAHKLGADRSLDN